jgi:hypothetical protein
MRIGELAEQAGISTKAIRYYEQIGILARPARTSSGYRVYDPAAVEKARIRPRRPGGWPHPWRDPPDHRLPRRRAGTLRPRHRLAAPPGRRAGYAHQGAPAAPRRAPATGRAGRHPRPGGLPARACLPRHHLTRCRHRGSQGAAQRWAVRRRWGQAPIPRPGPTRRRGE